MGDPFMTPTLNFSLQSNLTLTAAVVLLSRLGVWCP